MRALIDRHHSDLFYAMQRLFEDRLGIELYTPIGREWWDEGYWQFGIGYGDDRLVRQFLSDPQSPTDGHHPGRPIRYTTLGLAKQREWSHVICTVEDNQAGFKRLADEIGAKYVVQVGNTRQTIDHSLEPILLDLPQEFDHTTTFRYREPTGTGVTSFVNLLPLIPEAWAPFDGLRDRLRDYTFRSFGHECPDGFRDPVSAVADEMALAGWAYHDKVTGDGFGHVIHNWAAVGRPLIGHASYYEGQRAEVFWTPDTSIDLDVHSLDEAAEMIRSTTPERHAQMCRAIRAIFDEVYDPEADAETARRLLL